MNQSVDSGREHHKGLKFPGHPRLVSVQVAHVLKFPGHPRLVSVQVDHVLHIAWVCQDRLGSRDSVFFSVLLETAPFFFFWI